MWHMKQIVERLKRLSYQTIAGTNLIVIVYQSFVILKAGWNDLLDVLFSIFNLCNWLVLTQSVWLRDCFRPFKTCFFSFEAAIAQSSLLSFFQVQVLFRELENLQTNSEDCNKYCPKSGTPEAKIHLQSALKGDTPSTEWS